MGQFQGHVSHLPVDIVGKLKNILSYSYESLWSIICVLFGCCFLYVSMSSPPKGNVCEGSDLDSWCTNQGEKIDKKEHTNSACY